MEEVGVSFLENTSAFFSAVSVSLYTVWVHRREAKGVGLKVQDKGKIIWPEKISKEDLYKTADQETVAVQIRRRKWGWTGRTLRKPASNITRQTLTWNPQGKRKRGRPTDPEKKVGLDWPHPQEASQ